MFIFEESLTRRPLYLILLFQSSLLLIGMVGVMVAMIPWIAIPVILLGIIFFVLRRYFLKTSQDVKRLESTSEYTGTLRLGWQCRLASGDSVFWNFSVS